MSWSLSLGDSSRRKHTAMAATTNPAIPHTTNWSCHTTPSTGEYQKWTWFSVWLATSVTTRLPRAGPRVQNPIAEARPT